MNETASQELNSNTAGCQFGSFMKLSSYCLRETIKISDDPPVHPTHLYLGRVRRIKI